MSRYHRFIRGFVVALVLLASLEVFFRFKFQPVWYEAFQETAENHRIDYIFIGSSRVAAAIDAETFAEAMGDNEGRTVRAVNLGQGYMTVTMHEIGLENAFHAHAENLRGSTVFIEAPAGVPIFDDRLFHPDRPSLLLHVMHTRDLPRLWEGDFVFGTKTLLTTMHFASAWKTFHRRASFRRWAFRGMERGLGAIFHDLPPAPDAGQADLSAKGGTITEKARINDARRTAVLISDQLRREQKPLRQWSENPIGRIVALAQRYDCQVVFYTMPLSTVFARVYDTDIRRADARHFEQQASSWNAALIHPEFATTDADFPDLWHLRKSASKAFTKSLAQAYLSRNL